MWQMIKNKMFWLYMVAVCVLIGFFSFVQIYSKNTAEVKDLPVAIVNQSNDQASKKIINKLKKQSGSQSKLKFIEVKDVNKIDQGFADKKYYGAIILNKNFDKALNERQNYLKGLVIQDKLSAVPPEAQQVNPQLQAQKQVAESATAKQPEQAKITVLVNQGANAQAAALMTTALPKMGEGLGQGMAQQMQKALSQNNVKLDTKQWQTVASPIKVSTEIKNKVPDNSISGAAPMMIVVLAWLGSMIGSILLWREHKQLTNSGHFSVKQINSQLVAGALLAIIGSGAIYLFASVMFGIPVPNVSTFIGLLIFNIFIFYLLQTCILDWLGLKGWPLILLVWLLSAGILTYPKEMLSSFFRNFVYSWTPIRFSMDSFVNNLYIHGSSATEQTNFIVLISIGVVSLVLLYLSTLLNKDDKK